MTMNFEKALTINSRGYAFYANYYNIGFVIILVIIFLFYVP